MGEEQAQTVQELLRIREARGLQVPAVVRILFVLFGCSMAFVSPMAWGSRLMILAIALPMAAVSGYFLILLRKAEKVRFVGIAGLVLDSVSVLMYPFIVYQASDLPSVPLGVVSASPAVLAVCMTYIVIESLALRPAYTFVITCSALLTHLIMILFSVNHPSASWAGDVSFFSDPSTVSLSGILAWMIFLLIVGGSLIWLTGSVRKTVVQAAELEAERTHMVREQANLLMDSRIGVMGELVAGVSHEMNNPLAAVKANAETGRRAVGRIREGIQDGQATAGSPAGLEPILDALEQSSRSTQVATDRMETTLKTLRSFARMDEAEFKDVDVHEALENTLALIPPETIGDIPVVKHFGELPRIQAYAGRLNQVFMTLLTRAFEAVGDEGEVTIVTESSGDDVVIRFIDTGAQIPRDQLDHLFDIRLRTRQSRIEAGFGMAACQSIVGQHKGKLEVQSIKDEGTTFTIVLPIKA